MKQGQDQCEQRDAQGHPETGKDNRKVKGRPFLISLVGLLDSVPGTLFLKTLHPDRHLAIPVDFVEIVPGTDGYYLGGGPIPLCKGAIYAHAG